MGLLSPAWGRSPTHNATSHLGAAARAIGMRRALSPVTMQTNNFSFSSISPRARKLLRFCLNGADATMAMALATPVVNNWGEVSIPQCNINSLYRLISADTSDAMFERGMAIVWLAEALRGETNLEVTIDLAWAAIDTKLDYSARVAAGEDMNRGW